MKQHTLNTHKREINLRRCRIVSREEKKWKINKSLTWLFVFKRQENEYYFNWIFWAFFQNKVFLVCKITSKELIQKVHLVRRRKMRSKSLKWNQPQTLFWQKLDNFLKESYLGKASKNQVRLVCGNATLIPDIRAECKITAPTSYLAAKSTVGTVPILWPYRMIFSGLTPYLERRAPQAASISA